MSVVNFGFGWERVLEVCSKLWFWVGEGVGGLQ